MHSILSRWESFYVIIGSAAAALIGLQFVAAVLGAELRVVGGESVTRAFGTPTIVHFGVVLLNAAFLSAPWPSETGVSILVGTFGMAGVVYTLRVAQHARRQTLYKPVLEDWIWHTIVPLVAYAAMLASAIRLPRAPAETLFAVAGSASLLLCAGIHNAWDSLNYIALRRRRAAADEAAKGGGDEPDGAPPT
ncbi:MAG TPA: hypothetical protein VHO67_10365 [Polyangia bacterium]|nr:hypothetical protein [Polyangia bacterium]